MRKITLLATASAMLLATVPAYAADQTIGAAFHTFDDNFVNLVRNGMIAHAEDFDGLTLQVESAKLDVGHQLDQIQTMIASGVDALIVLPVDTDGTVAITQMAEDAGVPLVYVNREPINVDNLPANQAFIASNEEDSGTMQTEEVCRLLKERGLGDGARVAVLQGQLGNFAARVRTQDIENVIATPECDFMEIVASESANWQRVEARDFVTNWLSADIGFDAIIANNDEMAIGAIQAVKAAGLDTSDFVIAGIDATMDGLEALKAGDLDVTVFQDAAGQGAGGIDLVRKIIAGEPFDQKTYIPFLLVTPENYAEFENRN